MIDDGTFRIAKRFLSGNTRRGKGARACSGSRAAKLETGVVMATVIHLGTYNELEFSCSPRQAVIAAYAQSRGDWNTWDYEQKYGHMVKLIRGRTWSLGDFACVERYHPRVA